MDFSLTEDEGLVVDTAAAFAARHLAPDHRAHESAHALPPSVLDAFVDAGLPLLCSDDPDEALGLSGPARMAVLRTLAQADAGAAMALWMRALAPQLASRLDANGPPPSAVIVRDALDPVGSTLPICHSGGGDHVLLIAPGAWALARIEGDAQPALGLWAASPVRGRIVDWVDHGEADTGPALAELRLAGAAMLAGIAAASCSYTAQYSQERIAFGKTLAQHQGYAFLLAEVAMSVASAVVMVDRAAWELDRGNCAPATDAWLEAIESALHVGEMGVQLLGGHGYMTDHPVEKWMRDARALSLLFGGRDAARRDAAGVR